MVSIRSAVVAVLNVKMRSMFCWCADFLVCAHSGRHIDLFGGFSSFSPNAVASYAESPRAVPAYFGYQFTNQCKNHVYPFISVLMDFYSFFNVVLFTPPSDLHRLSSFFGSPVKWENIRDFILRFWKFGPVADLGLHLAQIDAKMTHRHPWSSCSPRLSFRTKLDMRASGI